ncbi:MAG: tetratricopeptide repeat protein [Gammaproteobacteria bacterium]|jgi:TolB-like protein|nr:tetratricopeptide repeat protein [Gammaproteobacteria bacterium]
MDDEFGEVGEVRSTFGLTPRQLEILELVSKGLSNREIGELLGISGNTVTIHVTAILRGLDVANRTEATAAYKELLQAQHAAARRARTAQAVGRPTIAVLPLANLGEAADTDHLAAGLVEDLIMRLSGWRWFPVIASASSGRYPGERFDLAVLRDELGAGYVISGSVRQSTGRIRVSVHLVETERGETIWSGSFEAGLADLLASQDEVARRVVASLAPELMHVEGQRVPADIASDFGAWRLTMQGMWHLSLRTPDDVAMASSLFERALAADTRFGLAWYGLTWCAHHELLEQWTDDPAAARARLERAAAECLRLDPAGAPGQTVAGLVEMLRGDRDKAVAHLEKSAVLDPSNTRALSLLGQCYGLAGQPDACIATLEEALKLNPMDPTVWRYHGVIALAHFAARRHDEAIAWARRALHGRPEMITAHLTLCAALVERGDVAAGREVIAQMRARRPQFTLEDFVDLIAPSSRLEYIDRFRDALAQAGFAG